MISTIMVSESVTVTAAVGLRVLPSCQSSCNFFIADSGTEQISAMIMPYDAVAPPPVKPARVPRRRTLLRRKRRTKRRLSDDGSGDARNEGFFYGDGGDGPFGGGGGFGGSGGGWNYNRFGDGHNWDEPSLPDPAFDFVYQVLSWIMLSNCLHFSFKKIVRIVADSDRGKVPARLAPIC